MKMQPGSEGHWIRIGDVASGPKDRVMRAQHRSAGRAADLGTNRRFIVEPLGGDNLEGGK